MKSIITSVVALAGIISTNAANQQTSFSQSTLDSYSNEAHISKYSPEETILNPSAYISSGLTKSTADVLKSDNEIVQADHATQKAMPLVIERTLFDVIDENNSIIEHVVPVTAPLSGR